ncbi:MAG: Hpt domain-containing protein [Gammaproteobacteria bacterium]|nr:Hpt domain-containing protein [Gammaproteobacteria bacterium]
MKTYSDADPTPVIDWELGIKLAGNNRVLAIDMLKIFAKSLPDEMNAIIQATHTHNTVELLLHLHKLRGGVSYCGLPRLKKTIIAFEKDVKKNKTKNLTSCFAEFENEVVLALDRIGRITE